MKNGLGAYKKTSVHTANKEQILLMLYQAAIKNCRKAIQAVEEKNIPDKGKYIGNFQDIVIELNNSLDFEVGGDVAKELTSLYDYLLYASSQANINLDPAPLVSCEEVVTTLYDGWLEAIKSLKSQAA